MFYLSSMFFFPRLNELFSRQFDTNRSNSCHSPYIPVKCLRQISSLSISVHDYRVSFSMVSLNFIEFVQLDFFEITPNIRITEHHRRHLFVVVINSCVSFQEEKKMFFLLIVIFTFDHSTMSKSKYWRQQTDERTNKRSLMKNKRKRKKTMLIEDYYVNQR